ncbi:MAG TPA: PadR family transcriptional regulator [Ktedonobacterales bacterium]
MSQRPPDDESGAPEPVRDESSTEGESARATLRYILLGLLGARPMTGYDMKQAFDRSLATYWNAGFSQIYTTLKTLEGKGLVRSEVDDAEGRRLRRLYHLTTAGRVALDEWLRQPIPDRFTKDEFLTRLFFCGQTSDEATLHHLEEHRAAVEAQLSEMARALRDYGNRSTRQPRLLEFQMLVRDYKQAMLEADLAVTQRAIATLGGRTGGASPGDGAQRIAGQH